MFYPLAWNAAIVNFVPITAFKQIAVTSLPMIWTSSPMWTKKLLMTIKLSRILMRLRTDSPTRTSKFQASMVIVWFLIQSKKKISILRLIKTMNLSGDFAHRWDQSAWTWTTKARSSSYPTCWTNRIWTSITVVTMWFHSVPSLTMSLMRLSTLRVSPTVPILYRLLRKARKAFPVMDNDKRIMKPHQSTMATNAKPPKMFQTATLKLFFSDNLEHWRKRRTYLLYHW